MPGVGAGIERVATRGALPEEVFNVVRDKYFDLQLMIGATAEHVLQELGAPSAIVEYSDLEYWFYHCECYGDIRDCVIPLKDGAYTALREWTGNVGPQYPSFGLHCQGHT